MNKKKIGFIALFTCVSIITSFITYDIIASARKPIENGDHVFDAQRYVEQKAKTAQLVMSVKNHIEMINNQITNLTNIDNNFLTIFNLNIKKNTTFVEKAHLENTGALNKDTTTQNIIQTKFKLLDDDQFAKGDFVTEEHQRRIFLNNTYKDAFRTSQHILKGFENNVNEITDIHKQIENAEGNLSQQQLKNILSNKQLEHKINSMQLDAHLSTIKRMNLQSLIEQEDYSRRRGHYLKQASVDPYNMTSEDEMKSIKKPSQGFIKFK